LLEHVTVPAGSVDIRAENPVIAILGEFKGLVPSENCMMSPSREFQVIGTRPGANAERGRSTVNGLLDAVRPQ
jgi:hypothetical protein